MSLKFDLINDAWLDFGAVYYTQILSKIKEGGIDIIKEIDIGEQKITISFNEKYEISEIVEIINNEGINELVNQLFILEPAVKFLNTKKNYSFNIPKTNGFIDYKKGLNLTKKAKEDLKEKFSSIPKKFVRNRPNFIGLKRGAKKIKKKIKKIQKQAISEGIEEGKRTCPLCQSKYLTETKMKVLQLYLPNISSHQNLRIRDFTKTQADIKCCSKCILRGVIANLFPRHIFSRVGKGRDKITKIFIPMLNNFKLLDTFQNSLKDLMGVRNFNDEDWIYYNNNLKNVFENNEKYILLTIFSRMVNDWNNKQKEKESENNESGVVGIKTLKQKFSKRVPEKTVEKNLSNWMIFNVEKGRVVSLDGRIIRVPKKIFKIVEDFQFFYFDKENKKESENTNVIELLKRMKTDEMFNLKFHIAEAVLENNMDALKESFYMAYKKNENKGYVFRYRAMTFFIEHFLKVNKIMIEKEKFEELRTLAYIFAESLYDDVTLMSKLYNSTSQESLKQVIGEMFFKIYKKAKKSNSGKSFSADKVQNLFELIDSEYWKELHAVLISFICMYSINKMNKKKSSE